MKAAKIIRIITVPPLMAIVLLLLLWFRRPVFFAERINFFIAVSCLTLLPLAAYPFSLLFRHRKRDYRILQRHLAIVFTLIGYTVLIFYAFFVKSTVYEKELYTVYAVSSIIIALTSISEKTKISGHACSISGPIFAAAYYVSPLFLLCYFIMLPVFWSSIILKRHTPIQLAAGAIIPIVIFIFLRFSGIFY